MKKIKLILFSYIISLVCSASLFAQMIEVGSPQFVNSLNQYGIMNSSSSSMTAWNRHIYLYPTSLLAGMPSGAAINSLAFNRAVSQSNFMAGALSGTPTFKIWLANIPANMTTFGQHILTWNAALTTYAATKVYDSNPSAIVGNSSGIKVFPLLSNFNYTGGSVVMFVEYTQAAAASADEVLWSYNNNSSNGGVSNYESHSVKYAIGLSGSPTDSLKETDNRHPNVQFRFTTAPCTGTPSAGTNPTNPSICNGSSATLIVTGASAGTGISYQWQESNTLNGTYTNVSTGTGINNTTYITQNLTATKYYRLVVNCSGGSMAIGNPITVTVGSGVLPLPLNENFNTLSRECWGTQVVANVGGADIPEISFTPSAAAPPTAAPEGTTMLRFNSYSCDAGDKLRFTSPNFSTTGTQGVEVSFKMYEDYDAFVNNLDKVSLQYSLDGSTWTSVAENRRTNESYPSSGGNTGFWYQRYFTLPSEVSNRASVQIGFLLESAAGNDVYIDDIKINASNPIQPTGDCSEIVTLTKVSGNNWFRAYSTDGNILAEINPQGNNLGNVIFKYFVNNSGQIRMVNNRAYLDRNIEILPQTQPSSLVAVRLYYKDTELAALNTADGNSTAANIGVTKVSGASGAACSYAFEGGDTQFIAQNTNGVFPVAGHYLGFQTNRFSQFFIHGGSMLILPLDLLSFEGKNILEGNELRWKTANEKNIVSFEIERIAKRNNGDETWEKIGTLKAQNGVSQDYTFVDTRPYPTTYYRLRMVENDGKSQLSNVIVLQQKGQKMDKLAILNLYPQPAHDQLRVDYTTSNGNTIQWAITDLLGRELMYNQTNEQPLNIKIDVLPSGLYFLTLKDGVERITQQLIKQ